MAHKLWKADFSGHIFLRQCKFYTVNPIEALICTDTHTTISGKTCQNWNSNWPHRPNDKMRSRLGFTGHNFCAIADPYDSRPFCYTTDPNKRWEYCDCQICNRTESGSECLRWDAPYIYVSDSKGSQFSQVRRTYLQVKEKFFLYYIIIH